MEDESSSNDDEMFSYDIENECNVPKVTSKKEIKNDNQMLESLISPKSILYRAKENDDNVTIAIIKSVVTLFIICFILPFILADLYIAYTDKTCVNIYPDKLKISLSIYLQVNSYILLVVLSVYIALIHKKIKLFACNEITKTIFCLFVYITRIIIFGWNVLGAIIFWGYISEKGNCSVLVYNYLYATFILRLLVIILLILNTKNNIKNN